MENQEAVDGLIRRYRWVRRLTFLIILSVVVWLAFMAYAIWRIYRG